MTITDPRATIAAELNAIGGHLVARLRADVAASWGGDLLLRRKPKPARTANRWRVERAGSPNGEGYGLGWMAMNLGTGTGAWKPTWEEALGVALRDGASELVSEATA